MFCVYNAGKNIKPPRTVLMVPGYNMCILRGFSVSDSFVTVIGDQMALKRPVFGPSVLTLKAVNLGALRGKQCVQHSF